MERRRSIIVVVIVGIISIVGGVLVDRWIGIVDGSNIAVNRCFLSCTATRKLNILVDGNCFDSYLFLFLIITTCVSL